MRKAFSFAALGLLVTSLGLSACSPSSSFVPSMDEKNVLFVDEEGIGYDLYEEGWMITDYRGEEKNIRIPASKTLDGQTHDVVGIAASAFYGRDKLAGIELPDTITSIGRSAFYGTSLETLYITSNITEIGEYAFDATPFAKKAENGILYLPSLENPRCGAYLQDQENRKKDGVVVPSGVEVAYEGVFAECSFKEAPSLESLVHVGKNAFAGAGLRGALNLPHVRAIEASAFENCTGLESLTVTGPLKSVGERAFARAANLKSVSLPSSVTSLGREIFASCSSLKNVELPFVGTSKKEAPLKLGAFLPGALALESLTILGGNLADDFLSYCTVGKLTLHTRTLTQKAMADYDRVDSLYLLDGVAFVESSACYMMPLSNVFLARSVSQVGGYAFYTSSSLLISCERSANQMENYAFMNGLYVDSSQVGEQTTVRFGVSPENI